MSSEQGVAFIFQGCSLQTLARIIFSTRSDRNPLQALNAVLSLSSSALPLSAWISGSTTLIVLCQKRQCTNVFKSLYYGQEDLGITVSNAVRMHVAIEALPPIDMIAALRYTLCCGLERQGWLHLGGSHLLDTNLLFLADGSAHTCISIILDVSVRSSSQLLILFQPNLVTFKQPAAGATPCPSETFCTVLPHLQPGIVSKVYKCSSDKDLQHLQGHWKDLRLSLPESFAGNPVVADVRFDHDYDAPCIAYPAPCVLSQLGLDASLSGLNDSRIQAAIARLSKDLPNACNGIFADAEVCISECRTWHKNEIKSAPGCLLQSAQKAIKSESNLPFSIELGPALHISDIPSLTSHDLKGKKVRAKAGPELHTFLCKLKEEEEEAFKKSVPRPVKPLFISTAPPKAAFTVRKKSGPMLKAKSAPAVATMVKKKKVAPTKVEIDADESALNVPALFASGHLSKLKIPQLKAYLKSVGLPVSGKKGDLEERVRVHLTPPVEIEQ